VREAELSSEGSGVRIEGPGTGVAAINRGNVLFGSSVIRLSGADDLTIDRLVLTGAQIGIWADSQADSDRVTVTRSELHHFGNAGILLDIGNDDTIVTENTVRNNGVGIDTRGANSLLRNNSALNNGVAISAMGSGGLVEENETFGSGFGIFVNNVLGAEPTSVLRNRSHHNSIGIDATGNAIVADNSVYENISTGIQVSDADVTRNLVYGNQVGIRAISCNPKHSVNHNRVWNNSDVGISLETIGSAIGNQVYGNSTGIATAPCLVFSTTVGTIANNLVYDNSNFGVTVSQAGLGLDITNNTIYQSVGDALRINDNSSDVTVRNNILLIDAGYDIFVDSDSQTRFVSDHNLLHQSPDANAHVGFFNNATQDALGDWQTATGQDVHSVVSDPQFIDIDGADNVLGYTTVGLGFDGGLDDNFHLHRASPAIDAAHAWYAPVVDREFFERADDPGTANTGSADYAETSLGVNLFSSVGVSQSVHGSNTFLALDLPIAFPFYGQSVTRVYVSSDDRSAVG
jgi:hypothetical protein